MTDALKQLLQDKLAEHRMNKIQAEHAANQDGSKHYKDMSIEPWDVLDTWPLEQQIGYHRGNILKYTMRMGSKDERLKEAKKIKHYAEKLVEVLKEQL